MPLVETLAATVASEGIGAIFSGVGSLITNIRSAWTGEPSPEKKAEIEQALMEIEFALSKAQTEINLQEAKHPNIFVSGWRPYIGWVCGTSLAYNFIGQPLITWIFAIYKITTPPPILDTGALVTLVLSLLGLGGLRTYEKYKNVNSKH